MSQAPRKAPRTAPGKRLGAAPPSPQPQPRPRPTSAAPTATAPAATDPQSRPCCPASADRVDVAVDMDVSERYVARILDQWLAAHRQQAQQQSSGANTAARTRQRGRG